MAKVRNSTKQMSMLMNGDDVLETASDMEQHVLQFYTRLYASNNMCTDNDLIERTFLILFLIVIMLCSYAIPR